VELAYKPENLKVSKMSAVDIVRILEIQNECELSVWAADDYRRELIRTDSLLLIVRLKKEVIGFIAARLLVDEPQIDTALNFSEAEILNFGIIEKFQQKGFGKFLFERFLRETLDLGVESIWLDVRASNLQAIKFYTGRGFIAAWIRKDFYALPLEDALIMKLECGDPSAGKFNKT